MNEKRFEMPLLRNVAPDIYIRGFYAQGCDAQGCVRKLVGLRSLPKEFSLKKLYFQEEIV